MKKNVKVKIEHMKQEAHHFKGRFKDLFKKGLPSLWDSNGKMVLKEKYDSLLKEIRTNHVKFQDMEKNLKGEVVIEKLKHNFQVLNQFQLIKSTLPPISYESHVELEVLSREMMDFGIPSRVFWIEIERFCNLKCQP